MKENPLKRENPLKFLEIKILLNLQIAFNNWNKRRITLLHNLEADVFVSNGDKIMKQKENNTFIHVNLENLIIARKKKESA